MVRIPIANIAGNRDVRFSWSYQAPETRRARNDFENMSKGPLASFLSGGARLGHSVKPEEDYETGTGFHYITMAGIRHWRVDVSPCPELSKKYVIKHSDRLVQAGDILMARSGEGTIGKIGIVEEGTKGCFADFAIRIRTDTSRLLPQFLRFALMTTHYQTLIAGEKKGLGNNTNIFPIQIHQFPVLSVSLEVQEEVVEKLESLEMMMSAARIRANEIDIQVQEEIVKSAESRC